MRVEDWSDWFRGRTGEEQPPAIHKPEAKTHLEDAVVTPAIGFQL
jgi:hypothetical protein